MHSFFQDLAYAWRQLRKSPGFALTAGLTLALGIGANTAIFTLIQGILLRSLPVADPALLYRLGDTSDCCVAGGIPGDAGATGDFSIFSYDLYQHLKNSAPEFENLAAVEAGPRQWTVRRGNTPAKSLYGEFVSGNYFSTLGIGPFAGRVLSSSDDTPSSAPTIVLSYQAWQATYAADPTIVGSTISIQAQPFTVIGVAAPGFFGDRVTDTPPTSGCLSRPSPICAETAPFSIMTIPTGSIRSGECAPAPTSLRCRPSCLSPCASGFSRARR